MADGFTPEEDTWYFPRVAGTFKERAGFHGCQMPEQLLGRIIRVCSHEGELCSIHSPAAPRRWPSPRSSGDNASASNSPPTTPQRGHARLAKVHPGDAPQRRPEPTMQRPSTANGKRTRRPQAPSPPQHQAQSHPARSRNRRLAPARIARQSGRICDGRPRRLKSQDHAAICRRSATWFGPYPAAGMVAACVAERSGPGDAASGANLGRRFRPGSVGSGLWSSQVGDCGLCQRRAESDRHVGPQTQRPARRARGVSAHRDGGSWRAVLRALAAGRSDCRQNDRRPQHVARRFGPRFGGLSVAHRLLPCPPQRQSADQRERRPDATARSSASCAAAMRRYPMRCI